jgi:hypothetical protein
MEGWEAGRASIDVAGADALCLRRQPRGKECGREESGEGGREGGREG